MPSLISCGDLPAEQALRALASPHEISDGIEQCLRSPRARQKFRNQLVNLPPIQGGAYTGKFREKIVDTKWNFMHT